ncbi:MAG TPA: DNA methyltransferase [Polyangia bacterium]|nr:DNA methyltransferase [Polyangia bacterium]
MSASFSSPPASAAPSRVVHHGDALDWLRAHAPLRDASVVTSLPDTSEVPHLTFPDWQRWFQDAATLVMQSVPDEGVAIFFQSDIRHAGLWVDKGALVARAAQHAGMNLLFHKIVCRKPPGTVTFGRASYSHLLAFARTVRATSGQASPDVIADGGFKPGVKAMGVNACLAACRFILAETQTRTVVDPFCGFGTVLAVANALGMAAIGVDLSARMCRRARALQIDLDGHGQEDAAADAPAHPDAETA